MSTESIVCKANLENNMMVAGNKMGREVGGPFMAGVGLVAGGFLAAAAAPEIVAGTIVVAGVAGIAVSGVQAYNRAVGKESHGVAPGIAAAASWGLKELTLLPAKLAAPLAIGSAGYAIGDSYGEKIFGTVGTGLGKLAGIVMCPEDAARYAHEPNPLAASLPHGGNNHTRKHHGTKSPG